MSLYRDEYQATLERASALEAELRELHQQQRLDQATIAVLNRQLRAKDCENAELAALIEQRREGVVSPARASNAVVVFVLAVMSLLVAHPLGPLAWLAANHELRRIDVSHGDPRHRPMVVAGKVLGIAATVIFVVSALLFVISFAQAPYHPYPGPARPW
jgi:hypothetical protein